MDEQQQMSEEQIAQAREIGQQIMNGAAQGDPICQEVKNLAEGVMQQNQQAISEVQSLTQQAQQKDEQAMQKIQLIQATCIYLQSAQMARLGAKLNYIKQLRGICPEGYEMQMFRSGGRVCKKCMKKKAEQGTKMSPVEEFKCGKKIKKGEKGTKTSRTGWTNTDGGYVKL